MDALVMAGGKGTRLNMGEKPLALLLGRPLLDYVISSLAESSVDRIVLAVTNSVPRTASWARTRGLRTVTTPGTGYVADMIWAVKSVGITEPLLIIMADLPLVTARTIDHILAVYQELPEPALSVHTGLKLHSEIGRRPDAVFNYQGQMIVPAGVNILDGSRIEEEQEDYHLILNCRELAINVNTPQDLLLCESILKKRD